MKPQGNDNALYSLEMVTCLAFYLVIQFLFGGTNMHDILEFCPFLKFNLPILEKNPNKHVFNCMTIALTGSPHPQASV